MYGICSDRVKIIIIIIIIIIIKKGREYKAERERFTPYQSNDPSPTVPTYRKKDEKGKTAAWPRKKHWPLLKSASPRLMISAIVMIIY